MVAGKESLIYFEELQQKQKRLYDDSADFGIFIDEETKKRARKELAELRDIYKSKVEKWGDGIHHGSDTKVWITYELDEGYYRGVVLNISYTHSFFHPSIIDKQSVPRTGPDNKYTESFSIWFERWSDKKHSFKED